ncbi:sodium:alanine symporter family protein [Erwinia sp. HR93]|uniref:alanine/glycine:cation symporter family protein n=1 Tax=Erwinia sp. HR93 TaxID=3094840 RepID=UPI002ADECBC3|nr:sodium:alanine symporter family protein [Erwinia sp. HR93]MEA1063534.1 sodium:alanine symporter family protein [Erwinia sp. HR93]
MLNFLFFINDLLWGSVLIYLIAGVGIWFTWRTRYIQFRYIRKIKVCFMKTPQQYATGLTSFQALCIGLAARIGSSNLSGTALAIVTGGPGAVFWMWVSGLLGMGISFAECSLAQLYKRRDDTGGFYGGPAWYIEHGLGMRWMGGLFAVLLIMGFGLFFNMLQADAITRALNHSFKGELPVTAIAAALFILTTLTIRRGVLGIARILQWLVPFMLLIWVIPGLGLLLWHVESLPGIAALIIRSAFGWHEVAAGVMGYTLSQALSGGFQHGLFSSEAGMGSAPNIAGAASSWPRHPAVQGIVQMFGIFIDIIIVGSITAGVVLLTDNLDGFITQTDGILVIQTMIDSLVGGWGDRLITLLIILVAFTTIIANAVYAENNLSYLMRPTPAHRLTLRLAILAMVVLGCFVHNPVLWQCANILMALLAITNLTAILLLSPVVKIIAADYIRQCSLGIRPLFIPSRYPDMREQLEPGVWEKAPASRLSNNDSD